jgi:phage shock protein PspC (stress-responsive transcriptional regulator)
VESSTAVSSRAGSPAPRRPGDESVLTLVGGVLAGVGSVFAGTHSILVTLIAVIAATVLAAMTLIIGR